MPATPLAQSSEPPDAAYCKHVVHYHLYHLYHYYLHFIVGLCGSWFRLLIKIRNIFGINIVWWKKKKIRVDSTFAINNVHTTTCEDDICLEVWRFDGFSRMGWRLLSIFCWPGYPRLSQSHNSLDPRNPEMPPCMNIDADYRSWDEGKFDLCLCCDLIYVAKHI